VFSSVLQRLFTNLDLWTERRWSRLLPPVTLCQNSQVTGEVGLYVSDLISLPGLFTSVTSFTTVI
jgi:hypothetical protein